MATPITLDDVKAAVTEVAAMHLPDPADQLACAQETWANRTDGFPKAFNEALGGFGLDADLTKKLVKQFQAELPEASRERRQREEAARKAAEKAAEDAAKETERLRVENLKNEINTRIAGLAMLQRNGAELQGKIGTIARSARDLARKNADPAVAMALETVTEVLDETNQLVEKMNTTIREARDDGRKDDLAAVNAAVTVVEGIYDRLQVLHATEIDNAHDAVQTAVDESSDRKTAVDTQAAIQRLVDKAKADLDAINGDQGIAKKVEAAVEQYKVDVNGATGADPTDNPDALVTAANDALRDAITANNEVVSRAGVATPVLADVQSAAGRVATERQNAQAALDDITRRSGAVQTAKNKEGARAGYTATQQKKAEEQKAEKENRFDRFLSSWKGHLTMLGLFGVGILLALVFGPWWLQMGATVVALLVLIAYSFSLLKGEKRKGAAAIPGAFFFGVLGILLFLGLFGHTDKGPLDGSSTPTPTATSSAKPAGNHPTQAELDAERTATAEASATEAANP